MAGLLRRLLPRKRGCIVKKSTGVWIIPAVLLTASLLAATAFAPKSDSLPYSSYSAEPDGAKAAYLLLEELGFQVERKSELHLGKAGIVLALGADYLEESENALTLPDEHRFTNQNIEYNAQEFVELLQPYYGTVIAFEEYGRSSVPLRLGTEAPLSLADITPDWLQILLAGLLLSVLAVLFLYRRRVGEPRQPEGFSRRAPLEGVYAMAAEMEKHRVYRDSAVSYYRFRARKGARWDERGQLGQAAARVSGEREAMSVMAEIDQKIRESKFE